MAKRKRLTPANPDYLEKTPALETKGMFPAYPDGVARQNAPRAPIADVARDAASSAALDEMSESIAKARQEGRFLLTLPLDIIQMDYLVRDRIEVDEDEMTVLVESLRQRGQQMPIEVAALDEGRFGLISGWRRCQALARLYKETGDAQFSSVQAILRRPAEASEAYLSMVEENEIRVGLSYYERARIAARAVDQAVFETEKKALLALYRAASRTKRSKIRSFLVIVRMLDGVLKFPAAIGERLGLSLARALEAEPGLGAQLKDALVAADVTDSKAELACLKAGISAREKAQKQSLSLALETTSSKAKPLPAIHKPCAGIEARVHKDGSLTLAGPGVDDALRLRLLEWLAQQGKN